MFRERACRQRFPVARQQWGASVRAYLSEFDCEPADSTADDGHDEPIPPVPLVLEPGAVRRLRSSIRRGGGGGTTSVPRWGSRDRSSSASSAGTAGLLERDLDLVLVEPFRLEKGDALRERRGSSLRVDEERDGARDELRAVAREGWERSHGPGTAYKQTWVGKLGGEARVRSESAESPATSEADFLFLILSRLWTLSFRVLTGMGIFGTLGTCN